MLTDLGFVIIGLVCGYMFGRTLGTATTLDNVWMALNSQSRRDAILRAPDSETLLKLMKEWKMF